MSILIFSSSLYQFSKVDSTVQMRFSLYKFSSSNFSEHFIRIGSQFKFEMSRIRICKSNRLSHWWFVEWCVVFICLDFGEHCICHLQVELHLMWLKSGIQDLRLNHENYLINLIHQLWTMKFFFVFMVCFHWLNCKILLVKFDFKICWEGVHWMHLAQDRDQWHLWTW
jgi:hypothetical protein